MTLEEIIKDAKQLLNTVTKRNEETFELSIVSEFTGEVRHTFKFDDKRSMIIADCNLMNAKLAQALIDRTAGVCTVIKTGPNHSQKTGYTR